MLFTSLAIARSLGTGGMVSKVLEDFIVVVGHPPAHVWYTPVTHLYRVPVHNSVEGVPHREVLI